MSKIFITLWCVFFATSPVYAIEPADEQRLEDVAERGRHVMPFDLEKTVHVFSKTQTGGIQKVIAKEPSDSEQVRLIRKHLSEISVEFQQGDFSNPARIHGEDMPGLQQLSTAEQGQIEIDYQTIPSGAQINYSSDRPALIEAIHQWFDAQLSDHARHAVPGHHKHEMMHTHD